MGERMRDIVYHIKRQKPQRKEENLNRIKYDWGRLVRGERNDKDCL